MQERLKVRRKNNIIPKPKFFAIAAVKTNRRFFIFFKHLPVLFISEGTNNVSLYPKKCLCPCTLCTYHISLNEHWKGRQKKENTYAVQLKKQQEHCKQESRDKDSTLLPK